MGLGIAVMVGDPAQAQLAEPDWVEVVERLGAPTAYRLHLPVEIRSGDLPRLTETSLEPGATLTILEVVGEEKTCLVKGPVRGQLIHLTHGGEGSWVEVNGADSSIRMDRESKWATWADVADSDAASSVLGNRGYSLDVQATPSKHLETKHVLVQNETDHHFVRRLARRNGCLFWLTCDPQGKETAHFRRPALDGQPAAELLLNVDGANLTSVDITWDVERPTSVVGAGLDLHSRSSLDGSRAATPQSLLGSRSLQAITGDTRSSHLWAPADDAGDLQARAEGLLVESDWFVRLNCQTSLNALGKLVRAHTVVSVDGLGKRHSGKYFVAAVRHTIDAAAHRMDLTLVRNAWSA